MPSPPAKMKPLPLLAELLKNRNHTFPAVHYFAWKLELVSNILQAIVGKVFRPT